VLAATEQAACLRAIQRFEIRDEDRRELEVRRVSTVSGSRSPPAHRPPIMALIGLIQTCYMPGPCTRKQKNPSATAFSSPRSRFVAWPMTFMNSLPKTSLTPLSLEVQFRNGTIAHLFNLDDVLYESNSGPKLITRFRMSFSLADSDPPSRSASIQFVHPWRHLFSNSVTYTVTSSDRDWALVVTSFIEERLSAIKRGLDPLSLMQWTLWTLIPITLGVLLFL
jgi:hypothetical protein